MKKVTLLFLMLFGAIGFAQKTTLKGNGVDNPIYYNQQQKEKTVVLTESQRAADASLKNLGENTPYFINKKSVVLSEGQRTADASIKNLGENKPAFLNLAANSKAKSAVPLVAQNRPQYLFMSLTEQEEILADQMYKANRPSGTNSTVVTVNRNPEADIVPTAGATETFNPVVGDHFFDPGGPGGSSTGGDPGNYPNCGCDTQTTLAGVSEIDFQFFSVFSTFDYLQIYDGTDASGTKLYDNGSGGANSGDITLSDMIASNGSSSFTSASGNFFFFFHASTVVDYGGWDVEIISAGGGGGSFPSPYCGPLEYNSDVEPITFVEVADISNRTDAAINGSPAHEDFTAIVGNMEEGESYTIALEGNTSGGYTCSFTVFIDWNQDGILDNASERYEIGTINNSTGEDGQQATSTITVPSGVAEGPTRMRVMKRYGATYAPDSCDGGSGYGQAEDYTIDVTADGGGGGSTACSQNNPENAFENGFTTSKDGSQIIATDINVPTDTDFSLEKMTVNIWMAPGETLNSADITFYDNASNLPGAVRNAYPAVVPVSQTVIGNNFGWDISEVVFEISPEMLPGAEGSATRYWVSFYVDISSGSGFIGSTSATIEGVPSAFSPDGGATWNVNAGWDTVYLFEGTCEDIGGGGGTGGPCATTGPSNGFENGKSFVKNLGRIAANDLTVVDGEDMLLETITFTAFIGSTGSGVNADNVDVFIYEDNGSGAPGALLTSQTSMVPTSQVVVGSNFGFDAWSVMLDITDVNLPGQTGAATTYWIGLSLEPTDGSNTFWENSTAGVIGYGEAYDDGAGFVVDGTLEGVYSFDGTCSPIGGGGTGGPCATTGPSNGFENGKSFVKNLGRIAANDLTVVDGEDMLLETITFTAFIGSTGSGVNADNVDVFIYEDNGSGAPGALLTSQTSMVPTSQVVVGGNFGFDAWSVMLDITDVNLPGQTGAATTYWIGLSLEPTDGSNTFWENSTAGVIGYGEAYDDGAGFVVDGTLEGVYSFDGTCSPIGGGGTGGPCATTGPSNGFENGKSFLKNLGRIAANDLTVVAGDNMLLETITFTAFIGSTGSGVNADNVDVFIYEDNGSGAPGALLTSETSMVPTSQVVIGTNFGFDAWSVELDITDVNLPGQAGSDTTYWIGLSLEPTDGSNTFWENSTAGVIGFGEAYDDGSGFIVDNTLEGVYTFAGTCSSTGGGITNDECSGAIALSCGDSVIGTTVDATIDDTTPPCGPAISSPGVWYSFDDTSGIAGDITVSLCDGTTTFDTKLSIYSGSSCSTLVCVDGNDDFCGLQSEVTFASDGNTKFYILVHSFGGATGTFTLDITCDSIGISENVFEGFSYYPNPTSDILNLNSVDKIESVSFYNMLGQRVIDNKVNATTSKVDISGLSIGTYLMKVTVNGQTGTYKVLKQ